MNPDDKLKAGKSPASGGTPVVFGAGKPFKAGTQEAADDRDPCRVVCPCVDNPGVPPDCTCENMADPCTCVSEGECPCQCESVDPCECVGYGDIPCPCVENPGPCPADFPDLPFPEYGQLMHGGPVEMAAPNPAWAAKFTEEKSKLQNQLKSSGVNAADIEHIGSTSVPGISAKPIVDMMVGVKDRVALAALSAAELGKLGYEERKAPRGGSAHRRLFSRAGADPAHVHVVVKHELLWDMHLNFRDYLRAHPQEARAYEQNKLKMAEHFAKDSIAYQRAKSPYIEVLNSRAEAWRSKQAK